MQSSYSVPQWSALLALRMLVGGYLFYLGLLALGVLGWEEPRQVSAGSLMLHYLTQYEPAPHFVAAAESVHATTLTVLGGTLVLGFFERAASALGLLLLLAAAVLEAPLLTETSVILCLLAMNEPIAAAIALAVTWAFPTGHVLGLDVMRQRPMTSMSASAGVIAEGEPVSANDGRFAPGGIHADTNQVATIGTVLRVQASGQPQRLPATSGEPS